MKTEESWLNFWQLEFVMGLWLRLALAHLLLAGNNIRRGGGMYSTECPIILSVICNGADVSLAVIHTYSKERCVIWTQTSRDWLSALLLATCQDYAISTACCCVHIVQIIALIDSNETSYDVRIGTEKTLNLWNESVWVRITEYLAKVRTIFRVFLIFSRFTSRLY